MFVKNELARAVYVRGNILVPGAVQEIPDECKDDLKGIQGVKVGSKSALERGTKDGDDMDDAARVATTVTDKPAPQSGDDKATEKAQTEAAKNAGKGK